MLLSQTSGIQAPIVVSVMHKDPLVQVGIESTLRRDARFTVRDAGHAVAPSSDARWLQAMDGIDVVIADYARALEISRALKNDAASRQAPATRVMIVTERDGESQIRQALETGIRGYLPIGCQPDEIADGVAALHRGQRLLGQVVAQRVAESFDHEALTERQTEVLHLMVAGYANKMVARELGISVGTVKVHVKCILDKLGARTRTEAATVAQRRGLVVHESPTPGPAIVSACLAARHDGAAAALR